MFAAVVVLTVIAKTTIPLLRGDFTTLPYSGWIPYSLESRTIFWLTFTFQSMGAMIVTNVIAATDSFIITMLLQLYAQIEILIHRMNMFSELHRMEDNAKKLYKTNVSNYYKREKIFLINWIQHHNFIY